MHRDESHKKICLLIVALACTLTTHTAYAVLYQPGETLDPACGPTESNCGVASLLASTGSVASFATSTSVGIGTTTPSNQLTVVGGISLSGTPSTTNQALYNTGGTLFWNGSEILTALASTFTNLTVTGSTSLQNITWTRATGTQATTTSLFSSLLDATTAIISNLIGTTGILTNLTSTYGTTTHATSTNFFTTNFTLSNFTGVLKATSGVVSTSSVDLASDVTGTLPLAAGGTNANSFSLNAFTYFDGTRLNSTSSPTVGYLIASSTATSTFTGGVVANLLRITGSATSTFTGGINLTAGCVAIQNVCVGGGSAGVSSISNSDGTLTISPTTGSAVASLNLGNANTWTALQTFSSGILSAASSTLSNLTTIRATTTNATTTNLAVSGIATFGTITQGTWNGSAITEQYGGTNQSSYTGGDILYASSANTLAKLGIGTGGFVLGVSQGLPA